MEVRQSNDEGLIRDVRELVVVALELAPQRLGKPHGGRTEKAFLDSFRRAARQWVMSRLMLKRSLRTLPIIEAMRPWRTGQDQYPQYIWPDEREAPL